MQSFHNAPKLTLEYYNRLIHGTSHQLSHAKELVLSANYWAITRDRQSISGRKVAKTLARAKPALVNGLNTRSVFSA